MYFLHSLLGLILIVSMMINSLSGQGIYHKSHNIENQDFVLFGEDENFCAITLADGVSSCKYAREGAEIACEILCRLFLTKGDFFLSSDVLKYSQNISKIILSNILRELKKKPDIKEYSSTIAGVLYDKNNDKMLCFNIGDGMIAGEKGGMHQVLIRPYQNENGCCVTTTLGAENVAEIKILDAEKIKSAIIFSDGAWKKIFSDKKFAFLNRFEELDNYLNNANCIDDYSYISLSKGGI